MKVLETPGASGEAILHQIVFLLFDE